MKKSIRRLLSFAIWFVLTLFLIAFLPDGETSAFIGIFLPIICAVAFNVYQKQKSKKAEYMKREIERLKADAERTMKQSIEDIAHLLKVSYSAPTFAEFIMYYNAAQKHAAALKEVDEAIATNIKIPHSFNVDVLDAEFQWHLRDSIENQCCKLISKSKGKYRNNRDGILSEYLIFCDDIETFSETVFSEETNRFALAQLSNLQKALKIEGQEKAETKSDTIKRNFDKMAGLEFEHWCADLLKQIGYANVLVTQSSGDQGVDVLAEKDGIKYAIQCKCYSSDLGNTPVQEVNAGKQMYDCHVGVVMTNRYFTKGAKELAAKTGVLLWDRDKLNSFVEIASIEN